MIVKEALTLVRSHLSLETTGTALWIVSFITKKAPSFLLAHPDAALTDSQQKDLAELLHKYTVEHKPLQYIVGSIPFLGVNITVEPPILIPRPETEYWCSWLIEHLKPLQGQTIQILDLCTGTGCIAIALAHAYPQAQVWAIDISPEACALALENVKNNNVTNVSVVQSDLFAHLDPNLTFDLIVSNPPYVTDAEWATLEPLVKLWEDPRALKAGMDGLDVIKRIINDGRSRLKETAEKDIPQIVIEIGRSQGQEVKKLFEAAGFTHVIVHKDEAGKDRFVTARRRS